MPPRKRQQSNAMLYILIAFVGLSIIAITFAIVYYVKAEDFKNREVIAQRDLDVYASSTEIANVGSLIGAKQSRQTFLGAMLEHLDRVVMLATGSVPQDTTAENKVAKVFDEVVKAIELTSKYASLANEDPNSVGLIRIIVDLKNKLDNSVDSEIALKKDLQKLQANFDAMQATTFEKEEQLISIKDRLQEEVNQTKQDYNDLEVRLNQTASQREQNLNVELKALEARADQLDQDLGRTQEELKVALASLRRAEKEIAIVKGPPDPNVPAYIPDGRIILIDQANNVVHISIGSDDRVYRGLTFSVYDKGQGIPKDGKAKAEIEVFDVAKSFAAARIVKPDKTRPILLGDTIANVIWDGSRSNVFVIAGQFDLDKNGSMDRNADSKITSLVEKWGGKVADTITADTDYLVLGDKPRLLKKPTPKDLEMDPQATAKYENAQRMLERYNQLMANAEALWIPILRYDRFLYLIGYKGQITRADAF